MRQVNRAIKRNIAALLPFIYDVYNLRFLLFNDDDGLIVVSFVKRKDLLDIGNPTQISDTASESESCSDKTHTATAISKAIAQRRAVATRADSVPNRNLLKVYFVPRYLSIVINVIKKVNALLDHTERAPAILHNILLRQDSEWDGK